MPRISLATLDTAGGTITNSQGIRSTCNGRPIAVVGDVVTPHPPPTPPHQSAVMQQGSSGLFVNGIRVCRAGDMATCGHAATAAAASTND